MLFQSLSLLYNRPIDKVRAVYHTYMPLACQGKLNFHDLQLLMLLKLNLKFRAAQRHRLFKHWVEYMQPIAESQVFITQIAQRHPVGLLTDTVDGFVERMQKRQLLPKLPYKDIIQSS